MPAPATLDILEGVPVYGTDISHELVTPTGAAIIRSLAQRFEPMPEMVIDRIGYGAGRRDLEERPNALRIILAAGVASDVPKDQISIIETSVDDMNPELCGYVMDRLFEDGALDVCWMPVYMKKNRPGLMLQVLCNHQHRDRLIDRVLMETTSIGVRYYETRRRLLRREQVEVQTSFGLIAVKRVQDPRGESRLVPEYDVCRQIALKKNIPLTAHVAIGTDIIYQHPSCDGAAIGKTSYKDFKIFTDSISKLEGGVLINIGSAVILPEVFLKSLTIARNLGYKVRNFTTANLDMIKHYRPTVNVVERPTSLGGKGYNIIDRHELTIPYLYKKIVGGLK